MGKWVIFVKKLKTMTAAIDEKTFKKVLFELMVEQPDYFKNLLRQIINEKTQAVSDEKTERQKRLEKIIENNFAEYDDVFRALA